MENRFLKIIEEVTVNPVKRRCAVVCPDRPTAEAALEAERMGLIEAVYFAVGGEAWGQGEIDPASIQQLASPREAAARAVEGVHGGELDMILKGNIDTAVLLKEVVSKDYGLLTGSLISHVSLLDLPAYHKMLILSDGGMVMYPDLEQLRGILENAVAAARGLGIEKPKVACLAAVEKSHDRMPETVRAAALKALNQRGEIKDCLVEGPISFDLAFSREAAAIKGYESPVAGDADILLVPDFVLGNVLAKAMVYTGGARLAGFLAGARSPVILTSRSASREEKIYSIAASALLSGKNF